MGKIGGRLKREGLSGLRFSRLIFSCSHLGVAVSLSCWGVVGEGEAGSEDVLEGDAGKTSSMNGVTCMTIRSRAHSDDRDDNQKEQKDQQLPIS